MAMQCKRCGHQGYFTDSHEKPYCAKCKKYWTPVSSLRDQIEELRQQFVNS